MIAAWIAAMVSVRLRPILGRACRICRGALQAAALRDALTTGYELDLDGGAIPAGLITATIAADPVASGLAADYLRWSSTVGSTVQVHLPDGSLLDGVAEAVDWDGRLVVRTAAGAVELASGDVQHVRTRPAGA